MSLTRLEHHQHPRPPHHELRQKTVFDSGVRSIGQVSNLYVVDERNLQFLDVCMSGFLGFGKKHHLVPAEAVTEESPGAVTLKVDQQTVEGAPTLAEPHIGPGGELPRAAREHQDFGAVLQARASQRNRASYPRGGPTMTRTPTTQIDTPSRSQRSGLNPSTSTPHRSAKAMKTPP